MRSVRIAVSERSLIARPRLGALVMRRNASFGSVGGVTRQALGSGLPLPTLAGFRIVQGMNLGIGT